MGNLDQWVLDHVNRFCNHYLGFTFVDTAEFSVPLIVLGGIVVAWMFFRPKRTRY
jgi:hypothetical protein